MARIVRTHVLLPQALVDERDRLVGQRRRSQFLADAAEEKLARVRRTEALAKAARILDPAKYPQWETPEQVSEWIHAQRAADDEHRTRKLARSD
jgi:metal-responsive CopG/Arc/MetJ family transcriptional regulator